MGPLPFAATFSIMFDFIYLRRNKQHSGEYWWKVHVDVLPRFAKTKISLPDGDKSSWPRRLWLLAMTTKSWTLQFASTYFFLFTFSSFRVTKDPALILSINDIVGQRHRGDIKVNINADFSESPNIVWFFRIFSLLTIFELGVIIRVCKVKYDTGTTFSPA